MSMHDELTEVTGGVDTHTDVHVAATVDGIGAILGTSSFPTTASGYRQLLAMIITAPDQLRDRCRNLDTDACVSICASLRPSPDLDPINATKLAMRTLARRHLGLTAEVTELDAAITTLCNEANPALLGARGIGTEVAATLLVTVGDNPHRMHTEAAFVALCGASPALRYETWLTSQTVAA